MLIGAPLVWSSDARSFNLTLFVATRAVEIATWVYLAGILCQFYRYTRLREYILQVHTYWLAGIVAYPISALLGGLVYLFRNVIHPSLYTFFFVVVSATWLVLLLAGRV